MSENQYKTNTKEKYKIDEFITEIDNFIKLGQFIIENKEKIKNITVDFNELIHSESFSNHPYPGGIYEGLIHTYPIEKTYKYIKDKYHLLDKQIEIITTENNVKQIGIIIPNINDNVNKVISDFNLCGYHLSFPKKENIGNAPWCLLQFEPKFLNNINDELRQNEKYLIHITPTYNVNKIKKIGFSPRSKNDLFEYPNRVYFVKNSINSNDLKDLIINLNKANKSEGNNGKYSLLYIDLSKINEKVLFYNGPNMTDGIYTTDYIGPEVINDIKNIDLYN